MTNQGQAPALSRFPDQPRVENPAGITAEPERPKAWIERKDEAMSEKVELSKGSLWLIGTLMVLAGLAFNYGGSVLGWSRDDAMHREKLQQINSDVQTIKQDMKNLNEAIRDMQIREATKRGYELKAAEGDHGQQPKQEQRK